METSEKKLEIKGLAKELAVAYKVIAESGIKDNLEENIKNILDARYRVTPLFIDSLDTDEVFVFGSELTTTNSGEKSAYSYAKDFGAKEDQHEGLIGQAYAIPTTNNKKQISIDSLEPAVKRFIDFAGENMEKTFYVTRIGGGNAHFRDKDVAELFSSALMHTNIFLPQAFIDVLFEKKGIDCPTDLVPRQSTGIEHFYGELSESLTLYIDWVKKNFTNKFVKLGLEGKDINETLEHISNHILHALMLYMKGIPSVAYDEIDKAMKIAVVRGHDYNNGGRNDSLANKEWKDLPANAETVFSRQEKNHTFYRMRYEANNWERKKVDHDGMFHIPFSLRGIVKTQRYSISGYPCLYLGEHTFACWEELGRPNFSNCLFSMFTNREEFKFLDLSIPGEEDWGAKDGSIEELLRLTYRFPFVIACTFRTHGNNDNFKPEYILPQLLLQWVKEQGYNINRRQEKADRKVFGIKYTSVNFPNTKQDSKTSGEHFGFEKEYFNNYVLPIQDVRSEYCSVLKDVFGWTDPFCEEYDRLKKGVCSQEGQAGSYENSEFGIMENNHIYGNDNESLQHAEATA